MSIKSAAVKFCTLVINMPKYDFQNCNIDKVIKTCSEKQTK